MKNIDKVKEAILSSAYGLFERHGYEKTSMDEIARHAHKAKASVYYHFKSKQDILREILTREFDTIMDKLNQIKSDGSCDRGSQLKAYLSARIKLLRDSKIYSRYLSSPSAYVPPEVAEVINELRGKFDSEEYSYFSLLCRDGIESGIIAPVVNPEVFSRMLQVTLKGLELLMFQSEDYETIKETYEAMIEYIIRN